MQFSTFSMQDFSQNEEDLPSYFRSNINEVYQNYVHIKHDAKEEINIEVGEKLPLLKDYLDIEDLNRVNKNITWEKDLKVDKDNKVYYSGTYDGYITFRGEKIKFKLNVIDE